MISDLSGLVLNIMVSLDFEKDKLLPSLTLVELGNQAYADGESGGGYSCSVETVCDDGGKISCSGEESCSRWKGTSVTCDGKVTYC